MKEIIIIPEKSLDLIDVYNNKNRAERRKSKKFKKRLKKRRRKNELQRT